MSAWARNREETYDSGHTVDAVSRERERDEDEYLLTYGVLARRRRHIGTR